MYLKSISVGYLEGASHLLTQVHKLGIKTFDEFVNLAISDKIRLRGTWEIIVNYCVDYRWIIIRQNDNFEFGEGIISILGKEDFLSLQRQLFWLYLKRENPNWLRYAKDGLRKVRKNINIDDEKQVLRHLKLIPESGRSDFEASSWWIKAADLARTLTQENKSLTGLEGEFLTLAYEKKRTGVDPVHVALESNNFGFDVLSQFSKSDKSPLSIEVKASTKSRYGATMFLTKYEYCKCEELKENYVLHLWDLSKDMPSLLIVQGDEVTKHIPRDIGEGKWETVKIKFDAFSWKNEIKFEADING